MLYKLKSLFFKQQYSIAEDTYNDTHEFIWGIKSVSDPSYGEANLYTLNDIDIVYDTEGKTYSLSIETGYEFKNEKSYIKSLFDKLTDWMTTQEYDTSRELDIYDVFTIGLNINSEFESLEELYATFKWLVKGFCGEQD